MARVEYRYVDDNGSRTEWRQRPSARDASRRAGLRTTSITVLNAAQVM